MTMQCPNLIHSSWSNNKYHKACRDYHGWRNLCFEYVKQNKTKTSRFCISQSAKTIYVFEKNCLRIFDLILWRACRSSIDNRLTIDNRQSIDKRQSTQIWRLSGSVSICICHPYEFEWRMRLSTSILGLFQIVNYVVRSWVRRTK